MAGIERRRSSALPFGSWSLQQGAVRRPARLLVLVAAVHDDAGDGRPVGRLRTKAAAARQPRRHRRLLPALVALISHICAVRGVTNARRPQQGQRQVKREDAKRRETKEPGKRAKSVSQRFVPAANNLSNNCPISLISRLERQQNDCVYSQFPSITSHLTPQHCHHARRLL